MSQHITEQLVEQVARAAHERQIEAVKASGRYVPPELLRSWDDLPVMEAFHRREYAMRDLQTIIPALLDAGWLPPAQHDAIREAVRDHSVNELHKSLMNALRRHPERGYHDTPEGLDGYSEGVEHGTISLASRIKTILDGAA